MGLVKRKHYQDPFFPVVLRTCLSSIFNAILHRLTECEQGKILLPLFAVQKVSPYTYHIRVLAAAIVIVLLKLQAKILSDIKGLCNRTDFLEERKKSDKKIYVAEDSLF